jgi:HNH endonuclease
MENFVRDQRKKGLNVRYEDVLRVLAQSERIPTSQAENDPVIRRVMNSLPIADIPFVEEPTVSVPSQPRNPIVYNGISVAKLMQTYERLIQQIYGMNLVSNILRRRGQEKFRKDLLYNYGGRCAITNCNVTSVLEAAHIRPYSDGGLTHPSNGILLRSDIHTLFDLDLLSINPDGSKGPIVELHSSCDKEPYNQYNCKILVLPGIDSKALEYRYGLFKQVKEQLTSEWKAVN